MTKPTQTLRRTTCAALTLAALAATTQTLLAAQASNEIVKLSEFQVSTSADKGYRAGNSVSATRIDTPIKDLPFAISAFTQQFITDVGARDLWDVVQYAPGVTSAGKEFNAGNSVYNIRGFDQAPQHNGFVGEGYVDTVSIERVEVVKGPSSVLYGQVAPGGTVNYITKRPGSKASLVANGQIGTDDYWRTSLDLNQPLAKNLLFRFNGAWENGFEYINPGEQRTTVLAPTVTWRVNDRISLTVDYQWFSRRETPPTAQIKPNIEVVALPGASGLLPTGGVLVRPDNSDPGFLSYYPLPRDFNYLSRNDNRASDFESVNAEMTVRLTDNWTTRANFNWNKRAVKQKLTGFGNVFVTVPTSYYPAGATLPISAANYLIAATAFANDVLKDPNIAAQAPQAQLPRRKRLQEQYDAAKTSQVEVAGNFKAGNTKLKPLFGVFYNESKGLGRQRQSGSAAFPNFPVWDIKNPATWDYNTDFEPAGLPFSTNSRSVRRNSAAYGVMNASFLEDRLSAVAGLRFNQSSGSTDNFLNPAASLKKVSSEKTTPQLGLGYKLTRDLMLYTSYSESYVLNASALTFQGVPVGPAKPTTSKGYELGVKTDFFNGRVSSTVAVFQIDQEDRILGFNSFNAAGATVTNSLQGTLDRSNGIEAELTWSPLDNWQIYVSGAITDIRTKEVPVGSEVFLGSHPEASVKALANLWTRYTFNDGALKGLWIGAGFNHTGKKAQRSNNPRLFLPSETLWNSAIGYDWKWENRPLTAVINWQNMADIEYFPANQQRGMPGRAVLSVTTRF